MNVSVVDLHGAEGMLACMVRKECLLTGRDNDRLAKNTTGAKRGT